MANKKPLRPLRTKGHPFRGTTSVRRDVHRNALNPRRSSGPLDHHPGFAVTGLPVPVYWQPVQRTGRVLWQNHSGRHSVLGGCSGSQPV